MIFGNKVVIRPLEIGDENILYKWWNDGYMMSHAGLAYGTLQSKEAIQRSIHKEIEIGELFPSRKRFILLTKSELKPIGEMNYNSYDARNQKAEFGIKICEIAEQGKGYGEDALSHFIEFMFRHLNLNKIELTTMSDNKKAQGLYKKLGFKEIGIVREAYYDGRSGSFSDIIYMDLLRREWKGLK